MATKAFVGTAYVKLMPSMKGFSNNIKTELANSGLTKNMSKAISQSIDKVDTKGIASKFSGMGDVMSSALKGVGGVAKNVFSEIGSLASSAVSTVTTATKALTAAGAAATAAIGKSALQAFSDNEQLAGGIDTIFKDASDKVKGYADEAFATTGMSANEYMESVTGFSASLIASLGGDTAKAADYANTAMSDIADNANKMGTAQDSLVQTYQSLARGNFGMLDNLKLGYGGTKEEAERLLADAEKISGIHYDIGNFGDITQAIHVIQNEMGITGATAAEAATTIEGSTKMMKASWKNWVTGLGQDNADMAKLTENLANSIDTMLSNVVPRLGVIFQSIASELPNLISRVLQNAPQMITDIVPSLISSIGGAVGAIAAAIPQIVGALVPAIAGALNQLSDMIESDDSGFSRSLYNTIRDGLNTLIPALARFIPDFYVLGLQILTSVILGIVEAIPENVDVIIGAIENFIDTILDFLPEFIGNFIIAVGDIANGIIEQLPTILPKILEAISMILVDNLPVLLDVCIQTATKLLQTLAQVLPTLLPQITQGIVDFVSAMVQVITDNLPMFIEAAFQIIGALLEGLFESLPVLLESLPDLITQTIDAVIACLPQIIDGCIMLIELLVEHLPEIIIALVEAIPDIVQALLDGLIKAAPKLLEGGFKLVEAIIEGITQMLSKLPEVAWSIVNTIWEVVSTLPGKLLELGGQIVQGLIDGISGAIGSVGDAIGDLGDSVVQGFCDFFGIHSPSLLFQQYGDYMMQGLANGIDEGSKDVLSTINGVSKEIDNASQFNAKSQVDYQWSLDNASAAGDAQVEYTNSLISAFNNVAIYMDSTQVSKLTAGARDKVDGSRQNFVNRGLAVA